MSENKIKINDQYVLSALDGKKMMDEDENVVLLDVRTVEEYINLRIPKSELLPVSDISYLVQDLYPNKELTYILYCRSGVRSVYARNVMKHLGYHHVYDMGGIIDWPFEKISG